MPKGSVVAKTVGQNVYYYLKYRNGKKVFTDYLGKEVIELFKQYDITDYVLPCYEALHTTGADYIVEDMDLFIEAHQPV